MLKIIISYFLSLWHWQYLLKILYIDTFRSFSESGEQVVVTPGHVVVQHRAPQTQVVGERLCVQELTSQNRLLAAPENK